MPEKIIDFIEYDIEGSLETLDINRVITETRSEGCVVVLVLLYQLALSNSQERITHDLLVKYTTLKKCKIHLILSKLKTYSWYMIMDVKKKGKKGILYYVGKK